MGLSYEITVYNGNADSPSRGVTHWGFLYNLGHTLGYSRTFFMFGEEKGISYSCIG